MNISTLLATMKDAIMMPDLEKITAEYKLTSAAICGDEDALRKRADDPLGAIEVMAARSKAASLIAKSKSRLDALINLELETLQKVEKYVTGLAEESRIEGKPRLRRSFQDSIEADEIWRETHRGVGPYSGAPCLGGDRVEKVDPAANVGDIMLRRRFQS
jgi:hypothetical protein